MSTEIVKIGKLEYRAIIKYLYLKGLRGKQIYEDMLNTLGDQCPSYATVKNWTASFKRGKFSIEDDDRSGRPVSVSVPENIDAVHDMILSNRRIGLKQISEALNISYERVHHIVHVNLDMRKIAAKWIPKCLNVDQKRARVEASRSICARFENDVDFLNRIVTMDETWVHFYDPETKQQSMEWRHSGSPRPKKFRVQKSAGKVLASVFWDCHGVIMIDFLDKGRTITGDYYSTLLTTLRDKIKEKRRGKLSKGVLFLQDNAPAHKSHVVMQKIRDLGLELLEHPPYSPDLAPSDYYLFPQLKKSLKGRKFSSNEEVIEAVEVWFAEQEETFFLKGLETLQVRCNKCIQLRGEYVE